MTIKITPRGVFETGQSLLLIAIFGLLVWLQPWNQKTSTTTRKVSVSGSATIKAEPNEYTFTPYFQEKGSDKEKLKTSLTEKANEAVAKLKELGVQDKDIKIDASSYDYWYMVEGDLTPMTVSIQVVAENKDLAQKIQDYLLTTTAQGQMTPLATFSEDKKKELDKQAVEEASNDARSKAEAQAKLLDAKLGKVIEVNQGSESAFPGVYDSAKLSVSGSAEATTSSLPVLVGQNEYTQTVSITYELK